MSLIVDRGGLSLIRDLAVFRRGTSCIRLWCDRGSLWREYIQPSVVGWRRNSDGERNNLGSNQGHIGSRSVCYWRRAAKAYMAKHWKSLLFLLGPVMAWVCLELHACL